MVGSSASMAASKASRSAWAGPVSMKISVEPHQIMTRRSHRCSSRKAWMSARIWSSMARFEVSAMMLVPSRRFT